MPAPNAQVQYQDIALPLVSGTHFGRYPKISSEATWNFIVSDNWLVPYAGYANALDLNTGGLGRGIYTSYVGGFMIVVIGVQVYRITANFFGVLEITAPIGQLFTNAGDVYIAENNNKQIAITDGQYIYVYDYGTLVDNLVFTSSNPASTSGITFAFGESTVTDPSTPPADIPVAPGTFSNPGAIFFQGGQLIVAVGGTNNWVLSAYNNARIWPSTSAFVGAIQSKPDFCQAVVPVPGGGNNILVFGRNVVESWQRVQAVLFPFQRMPSFNVDYGCLNPASIASLKDYVVWLAVNEQSGPVIMKYSSGQIESISTDGIDYQLSNLTNPENCTGFLYQQDGHVLYQFTFPDDNISYAYDFETKLFFNVSDENLDYHIAREVVYYNNEYYFVSLNGGNIYNFDTRYTYAQYDLLGSPDAVQKIIPRIRICPPLRLPSQRYFIIRSIAFTMENGEPNYYTLNNGVPQHYFTQNAVSLSISRDGGQTYGSFWKKNMNLTGKYINRMEYLRCGHTNDASIQLRFTGLSRYVVTDGQVQVYE